MNRKIQNYIENYNIDTVIESLFDTSPYPMYNDNNEIIGVNTMPQTGRGYSSHYDWTADQYDFYMDNDYIYYDENERTWKTQHEALDPELNSVIDNYIAPMVYVTRLYSGTLPNGKRLIEDFALCDKIDDAETWDIIREIFPTLTYK